MTSRFLFCFLLPRDNVITFKPGMESLNDTQWDIVISGTGLPQSLLALYVLVAFTSTAQAN